MTHCRIYKRSPTFLTVAVREYLSIGRPQARHVSQSGVSTTELLFETSLTAVRMNMFWSSLVPSSTRALQLDLCRKEVPAELRPPRHSCRFAKWTVFSVPLLSLLPRSSNAPYLVGPWLLHSVFRHRTVLAARNRCRAGCWHIVLEAVRWETCSPQDVSSGRTQVLRTLAALSKAPHISGKRTFLDLHIHRHIETMCWWLAINSRFLELGHQRYVPLGVSMMALALFDFILLIL